MREDIPGLETRQHRLREIPITQGRKMPVVGPIKIFQLLAAPGQFLIEVGFDINELDFAL